MTAVGQLGSMQTAVVATATLAAAALLGLVLAYWTWTWFGPRGEASAPAIAQAAVSPGSASGLFGIVQREGRATAAAPAGLAVRLLGVVAASTRGNGYAVVQIEPRRTLAVREGDEIAPGVRVAEVHADHVILDRGGSRETLAWPQKTSAGESPPPPTGK